MAITASAGYPQHSGTFIPAIWSAKLTEKFYNNSVIPAITNSKYENEIKGVGDEVIIRNTPDIIIGDYEKNGIMDTQYPNAPTISLKIDKAKYFQYKLDDIDKYQSDINLMSDWSNDAGQQMKNVIDRLVLGSIYADAAAKNKGSNAGAVSGAYTLGVSGTPIQITKSTILDKIVEMGVVLDEQNVPDTDRWIVLPAWAMGYLKQSDIKDASLTGDAKSPLRNGLVGRIDRFELYMSNNVASVTDTNKCFYIMAGHKSACTFAAQMTKMETLRSERTFGDIVRGLNVFGFKVVKPESLAVLYGYKG